jgi:hypothetical protein
VSVPGSESKTLRDAWDENAPDWVRWARSPELDHAFWHLNLPVADATDMPLTSDIADLAVASLSLMNMDEMSNVVSEIARVLRPAGRFCFSVLHPINSWGDAGEVGYFQTVRYTEELEQDGTRMTLHDTHRPLSDYFSAMHDGGLPREASRGARARGCLPRGCARGRALAPAPGVPARSSCARPMTEQPSELHSRGRGASAALERRARKQ